MTDKDKAEVYDKVLYILNYRKELDDLYEDGDDDNGQQWDSSSILEEISNLFDHGQ